MMELFPSLAWFRRLAERMAQQPERYRRLGAIDLTLVPRIVFPDGHSELYSLAFEGITCRAVEQPASLDQVDGRHPVVMEGEYGAWREMIENIQSSGHADLGHTLNSLTLPDWPFRLWPGDQEGGQLDVDRFYRYAESLQEFFNEAAAIETRYAT